MVNSRAKGARGEREARDAVRKHWKSPSCERSAQRCGKETADLFGALPHCHLEVKRHRKIGALRFLDQADRDRRSSDIPIVLMREDQGEWVIMLRLEDSLKFAQALVTQHEAD